MGASAATLKCCHLEPNDILLQLSGPGATKTLLSQLPRAAVLGPTQPGLDSWDSPTSPMSPTNPPHAECTGGKGLVAALFALDIPELVRASGADAEEVVGAPELRPPRHFRSGATYSGQWLGSCRSGFGVQQWPDGTRYEGQWAANKAEGRGRMTFANGDIYTGEWLSGAFQGLGTYRAADGTTYYGEWEQDRRDGFGFEIAVGNVKYAGVFHGGFKDGLGVCLWPDGGQYFGHWSADQIHGLGVHRNAQGGVFRGTWRACAKHGIGCFVWSDGRCYMGRYEDNVEAGFGCYLDEDGLKCNVGFWEGGHFHRQAPHTTVASLTPALECLALLQPVPSTPSTDEIVLTRENSLERVRSRSRSPSPEDGKSGRRSSKTSQQGRRRLSWEATIRFPLTF